MLYRLKYATFITERITGDVLNRIKQLSNVAVASSQRFWHAITMWGKKEMKKKAFTF